MKRGSKYFIYIIFIILLISLFSACQKIDGYIEVEEIRVRNSEVFLSTDGVASTYQLQAPTVLPANATNTKVLYYVNPEYLQYFSVDKNGLITAKKLTEDNKVFIKAYSSTNPKAFALISVVVENVNVEEITFTKAKIHMQYDSEPMQLELNFLPYHAQQGRDVRFRSLNSEVATVDDMGVVTPQKVGVTTIIVEMGSSSISDKEVEGRVQIIVGYAPGLYALSVTNESPQFNQVVGQPQTISFSISRDLYENIDLNPDIKWYVAGIRDSRNDGEWEYDFAPDKNSQPTSFVVEARIQPKGEDIIILRSPTINLYKPFTNFEIRFNQLKGENYYYGESIEFVPPNDDGVSDRYDWYIKEKDSRGRGRYLGYSLSSINGGRYYIEPEREGSFTVTALMIKDEVAINSKEFTFNVIKYNLFDKIQLTPKMKAEERIPDGYEWSIHSYDKVTEEVGKGEQLGITTGNLPFTFIAKYSGWHILSCIPTLNGLPVNEKIGDATFPMRRYTEPIYIWETEEKTNIEYVLVDGVQVGEEFRPLIKWNPVGGINHFVVEVNVGSQTYLIDTLAKDIEQDIIYRDYGVVLPLSMVSLEQDFSVRIKQKGSVFSQRVEYKARTIEKKHYYFLKELSTGTNSYIQNMTELGELLNYIVAFRPNLLSIKEKNNQYLIKITTKLSYKKIDNAKYPAWDTQEYTDENILNIYKLVSGAINGYAIKEIKNFELSYDPIYDGYDILLELLDNQGYLYQTEEDIHNFDFATNYSNQGKREEVFAIDIKQAMEVSTSQQLLFAITNGKRPLPIVGSVAEEIYKEVKRISAEILHEEMSDFQKVLAIFDYLATEVENDRRLEDYSKSDAMLDNLYLYDSYYLEGAILHKKAVSIGKSKAFAILCWVEGIRCDIVRGMRFGQLYAWNKVWLGGGWYNIDTYIARTQRLDGSAINYSRFLLSDQEMKGYGYMTLAENNLADSTYLLDHAIKGYNVVENINDIEDVVQLYIPEVEENIYSFCIRLRQEENEEQDMIYNIKQEIDNCLENEEIECKNVLQIAGDYYIILIGRKL